MKLTKHLVAITAFVVTYAFAQSDKAAPDPSDPNTAVPPAHYRSAFEEYRSIGNDSVRDWKASNDNVGRIGGWKVYAREGQETAAPAAPSKSTPAAPAPALGKPAGPAMPSAPPHH